MQTAELYEFNKCRGICSESGVCVFGCVCPHVRIDLKLWVAILNWTFSVHRHQPLPTTVVVIVILWWTPNDWVVWRVVHAETRAAAGESWPDIYQATTHSASQDIRSDWWFVMVAGSVSISFAYPPTPLPPIAAHPFASLLHCRVIRTVTLYERGDDKRIYTQSQAEE